MQRIRCDIRATRWWSRDRSRHRLENADNLRRRRHRSRTHVLAVRLSSLYRLIHNHSEIESRSLLQADTRTKIIQNDTSTNVTRWWPSDYNWRCLESTDNLRHSCHQSLSALDRSNVTRFMYFDIRILPTSMRKTKNIIKRMYGKLSRSTSILEHKWHYTGSFYT